MHVSWRECIKHFSADAMFESSIRALQQGHPRRLTQGSLPTLMSEVKRPGRGQAKWEGTCGKETHVKPPKFSAASRLIEATRAIAFIPITSTSKLRVKASVKKRVWGGVPACQTSAVAAAS